MKRELMSRRIREAIVVLSVAALAGCMGATPVDGAAEREMKKRSVELQVFLGPEKEVQVRFAPFWAQVVAGRARSCMGPDPMDTSSPVRLREVSAPNELSEPEDIPLEASAALFGEALEVLAAQEAAPPKRLAALSRPDMAVEQVANLRRPSRPERIRKTLEVVSPAPTLAADPMVAGVEVRIGALVPRARRSPERLRLERRIVRTPERVKDQ